MLQRFSLKLIKIPSLQKRIERLVLLRTTITAINLKDDIELKNAKPLHEMPGFKKNLLDGLKHFLPRGERNKSIKMTDIHIEAYKSFGKIYRVEILNSKFVFISDLDIIRKAYQLDGKYPHRRFLDILKIYRENNTKTYPTAGILIDNGERWANTRFKCQAPLLQLDMVEKYIPRMLAVSSDFVDRVKYLKDEQSGEIDHFNQEIFKWTFETFGGIAFNTRLGFLDRNLPDNSDPAKILAAIEAITASVTDFEIGSLLWRTFPKFSKSYLVFAKSQEYIHEVILKYIEQAKEKMSQTQKRTSDPSILEMILQQDINSKDVTTFISDLLQAAADATSNSVGILLYLLAKNPEKQEKLHQEITRYVKSDSEINRKLLGEMTYLKGCIRESMRMMSVINGQRRYYTKDVVLGGYRIPAGTYVVLLSHVASRLPEYFDEPDKFKPERWLPGGPKMYSFASMPFGFGARICIGHRTATQQMELLLIKLIQNFRIEYHYEDIQMITRFISTPHIPLKFKFVDRHYK